MKGLHMKNSILALALTTLVVAAFFIFGLPGRSSVDAKAKFNTTNATTASTVSLIQQSGGIVLPNASIYALTTDNTIYVLSPGSTSFTRLARVSQINGNLIGLDFRPADNSATSVYGLTDTGSIYMINLASNQTGAATLVSTLSTRFAGGFQSLMDFNPVANALRLIGGNDQNFAAVNSNGGNLNAMAVQTPVAYASGDVNSGVDPNVTGGAYTNNFVGAPNTLFYAIDFDLDTFVTISSVNASGSSNTGGGLLQTIGRVVDSSGNQINFAPNVDIDIYTDGNRVNSLVGINGQSIFTIDLSQINTSLALGTIQSLVARTFTYTTPSGNIPPTGVFIDIAIPPFIAGQAPAPAPTPAPTPTPTPAPNIGMNPVQNPIISGPCNASFVILNQNQSSFTARITFQNTGVTLNGWQFSFQYANSQSLSNGISGPGPQTVTVNNFPFFQRLVPGRAVSFTFRGNLSGGNPVLYNFTLNGVQCSTR